MGQGIVCRCCGCGPYMNFQSWSNHVACHKDGRGTMVPGFSGAEQSHWDDILNEQDKEAYPLPTLMELLSLGDPIVDAAVRRHPNTPEEVKLWIDTKFAGISLEDFLEKIKTSEI